MQRDIVDHTENRRSGGFVAVTLIKKIIKLIKKKKNTTFFVFSSVEKLKVLWLCSHLCFF